MMQEDQTRAIRTVKRHQKVLEEMAARYRGEVLNYYGDGSLSIFNSASEAVRCAKEIQAEFQTEPQVPPRIGIHIGEVLIEEGKVFGDGVNLASRIESLGQSGMVLFSKKVYEEIKNQPDFMVSPPASVKFRFTSPGLLIRIGQSLQKKLKYKFKYKPKLLPGNEVQRASPS